MAGRRLPDSGGNAVNLSRKHLLSILRIALGAVFFYAGVIKINDPQAFAGNIAAYKLLPYFASYLMAAILPWLEVFSGLLLIIGLRVRAAAALVIFLNLIFMAALTAAMVRGLDIDCGCFKLGGSKTPAWLAFARDAVLLAIALIVFRCADRNQNENPPT
jgi:putative oxidoreductase